MPLRFPQYHRLASDPTTSAQPMAASLTQKIRQLKSLADEGELDGDDLEFVERIDELTGNGGAATLLSEAEARRVDELYRTLGG